LKNSLLASVLLATLGFVINTNSLSACGPYFEKDNTIDQAEPRVPMELYLKEQPGIVLPSFHRYYLTYAYAMFSGTQYQKENLSVFKTKRERDHAYRDWLSARKTYSDLPKVEHIQTSRKTGEYNYTENCFDDSFRYALEVLKARQKEFGRAHAGVIGWIASQDAVYANCSGLATLPIAPKDGLPEVFYRDYDYQLASAHFYRGAYDVAAAEFQKISDDKTSPHRATARYMVIRTLMRQRGDFGGGGATNVDIARVQKLIAETLADPNFLEIRTAVKQLQYVSDGKTGDYSKYAELMASQLLKPSATADIRFAGRELEYLMNLEQSSDRGVWTQTEKANPQETGAARDTAIVNELIKKNKNNEMLLWIFTYQSQSAAAQKLVRAKWKETQSPAWLVSVLAKLTAESPDVDAFLEAAARVDAKHAAYTTLQFFRLNLLGQRGKVKIGDIDRLDATLPVDFISSKNMLRALKFRYAQKLPDLIDSLARRVIPENGQPPRFSEKQHVFDSDAGLFLTYHASLGTYDAILRAGKLPKLLSLDLARAAWVRSVLMARVEDEGKFRSYLIEHDGALRADLGTIGKIDDAQGKREKIIFIILKSPGLRPHVTVAHDRGYASSLRLEQIDSFRENWWCRLKPPRRETAEYDHLELYNTIDDRFYRRLYTGKDPNRMTQFFDGAALAESQKLAATGFAIDFFSKYVFDWADRDKTNVDVPAALHYLVKMSRYGCTGDQNGKISQGAFLRLHRRYPKSPWAKKTPYWFN
jgi:hypothetical protein